MVKDLIYSKAEQWFKRHTNGVTDITYYTGPIGSAIATGYVGLDEAGSVVGIVSLDALEREVEQSSVKPLLVVSFRESLTSEQVKKVNEVLCNKVGSNGWLSLVVDCMDEAKVQAFGVDATTLDTMSTDALIEMLESLKRVRDEQAFLPFTFKRYSENFIVV